MCEEAERKRLLRRARNQRWLVKNREQGRAASASWREQNLEAAKANSRKSATNWRLNNLERARQAARDNYAKNPEAFIARARVREGVCAQATPAWLTKEDRDLIKGIYDLARWLTIRFGVPYQVDHIVPLRGRNVCGLHVPWNLRIITERENKSKGNRFDTDAHAHNHEATL